MKQICQNCGKGIMRGHKVSHAKQRTKKIFRPNLHWQRLVVKGVKKRMLLCTKCTKMLKKPSKAPQAKSKPQRE